MDVRSFTGKYYFILFRFGGLKSRIFITAGHQPAERMCILGDCLKGRTVICTWRPAFQAASQERRLIRGSMTRGYENQAPSAWPGFDGMLNCALRNISQSYNLAGVLN
jgi:hypothetical protein